MTTETTFYKTIIHTAKNFKDALINGINSTFVFIGGGLAYANGDTEIITTNDCTVCEKKTWDGMIAAKKVFPNEVELVIPKNTWLSGRIYKDFDDKLSIMTLNTHDIANNIYSMCIINSENNVYKCLYNNNNSPSTDEPTGDYSVADGFIQTTDGYVWKYMYHVKESNQFLTSDWIPIPYASNVSISDAEYNIDTSFIIPGSLNKIAIDNPGSGYINSTITVDAFSTGSSYIQVQSLSNIVSNMAVTGTGISSGTYITSTSFEYNRIYLSTPTIGSGGGALNPVSIKTRAYISGDGDGCEGDVELISGTVSNIPITLMGTGYTFANVTIYGTGSNASARAILPTKYGHGYSPAIECGVRSLMVIKKFGDIDSTEDGLVPVDIKFRQYGVMINPYKYGTDEILHFSDASAVISQTTDITLEAGNFYSTGDLVYQGSPSSPTFYGYVLTQDYYTVKLVNFYGTPLIGVLLTNGTISRPVVNYTKEGLEKYTGDILYVKNLSPIERVLNQSEEIKLIIEL